MVVITMENASPRLRGECTKYMLEIKAGVFVGSLSRIVCDLLWKNITESNEAGGAVLVYSADTEQGFELKMHGDPKRKVIDIDGVLLIETQV